MNDFNFKEWLLNLTVTEICGILFMAFIAINMMSAQHDANKAREAIAQAQEEYNNQIVCKSYGCGTRAQHAAMEQAMYQMAFGQ